MKEKSIKINALMNIAKTILGIIFPIITFPYVSRVLGPTSVGKVNFALSFISYFISLSSVGIPLYGIREIARVRNNKKELTTVFHELIFINLLFTLIVYLLFFIILLFSRRINQEYQLFLIMSLSILLNTLSIDWFYQGMEEYVYITLRSLFFQFLSLILMLLLVKNSNDYIKYAIIIVIANGGASILNLWNSKKYITYKIQEKYNIKRHLKPLLSIFILSILASIYLNMDVVILGYLSSNISVGFYSAGIKLIKIMISVVTSIGSVLLPRLSYYIVNQKSDSFENILQKSINLNFLIGIPMMVALIIMAKDVILLFAGDQYTKSIPVVIILSPLLLVTGSSNILGMQILYPKGFERYVVISAFIGAIVSLTLNFILVPKYDFIGTAITLIITEFIVAIIEWFFVKKIYKTILPSIQIIKYIISSIIMAIVIILINNIELNNYILFFIKFVAGSCTYFLFLLIMKENLTMDIINSIINKFYLKHFNGENKL